MSISHHTVARPSGRGFVAAGLAAQALLVLAAPHASAATTHQGVAPAGVARGTSSGLNAVVALSRTDVWAVGGYVDRRGGGTGLLGEHWDGRRWHLVPMPAPAGVGSAILGLSAVSPTDIWAAGYSQPDQYTTATLLEHWDGTAWSIVDSPTPPGYDGSGSVFQAVDAVSDDDIWAVGTSASWDLDIMQAVVEHWDGTSWTQESISAPGQVLGSSLTAVSFDSPDSGWAVGFHEFNRGRHVPLTEHWNGSSWSYVASPKGVSTRLRGLSGVTSLSSDDAWAVGTTTASTSDSVLIDHWDGTRWNAVTSPATPPHSGLDSVSAAAPDDVWAVGTSGFNAALAEHWDGSSWSIIDFPAPKGSISTPTSVSAASTTNVWTVGSATSKTTHLTNAIAARWNGSRWRLF